MTGSAATRYCVPLMTPKVGEVYMLDLGYEGKVRPIVIMSREDA